MEAGFPRTRGWSRGRIQAGGPSGSQELGGSCGIEQDALGRVGWEARHWEQQEALGREHLSRGARENQKIKKKKAKGEAMQGRGREVQGVGTCRCSSHINSGGVGLTRASGVPSVPHWVSCTPVFLEVESGAIPALHGSPSRCSSSPGMAPCPL